MKNLLSCLLVVLASVGVCQTPASTPSPAASPAAVAGPRHIAPGATVFIEPMGGFETYLGAALLKKKTPVVVVDKKDGADYVIAGGSQLDKAGWAKTIFVSPLAHAGASISMKDAHTGALVFAYAVDKANAYHGEQSTAEACAKHLKEAIEKK